MAQCVDLIVPVTGSAGAVSESVNGVNTAVPYVVGIHSTGTPATCSQYMLLTADDYKNLYSLDPATLGITPSSVLYVTSWGVGVVLLLWSLGYAIGAALKVVRMV